MKYGQKIRQVRCEIPDAPNCPCRFSRCDPQTNPYCEVSRLAERAVVSSKASGGPGLSESDALLQAFDKMAEFHRAEAKRRAGGEASIEGGGGRPRGVPGNQQYRESATPSDLDSPTSPPRKKRRTRAEMQEFGAASQRQITESYNSLVPAETRAWLDASDPLLDSILDSTEAPRDA